MELSFRIVLKCLLYPSDGGCHSPAAAEGGTGMPWFFAFFFLSGFCSILYEIVWLRLAMAQFGVTTPQVSIVLSAFMAGLGLGSWASGRLSRTYADKTHVPALRWYALTELLIGISAITVPLEFQWGRALLKYIPSFSSWSYHLSSGAMVALTIVPWCACMGATIPIGMLAIGRHDSSESKRSFSFLYLANVLGALAGTILPLLLIELYGFHGSLLIGAALNATLAATAFCLSLRSAPAALETEAGDRLPVDGPAVNFPNRTPLVLLFATGLTSMGIEVVWIRQFTPYLGTLVYAFAAILGLYLLATFLGSHAYRFWSRRYHQQGQAVWLLAAFFCLLPLVSADPFVPLSGAWRLTIGIAPLSALFGFVTPMLVDQWSGGNPERAGRAYAVNIIGCILGPLISGFLLLPIASERSVMILYSLPWFALGAYPKGILNTVRTERAVVREWWMLAAIGLLAAILIVKSRPYEDYFSPHVVLRDSTATIIATGNQMGKCLLVNGVGITQLTPITKIMAHLPMALLDHPPQNALDICFGMGTTYRSLLSWNIRTTAIELVPSVPRLLWYFHADGPELLRLPLSNVVIDDGRRYLERSPGLFDVITIDPPPPVEAAGSSLLYSQEFYSICRTRLQNGGILQQWLPGGDAVVRASVARALKESFAYVRVFPSLEGWGLHFIASDTPVPFRTPAELARIMPATAVSDLVEWGPERTPEKQFARVLSSEMRIDRLIAEAPQAPALRDDCPQNEYFAVRRLRHQ